MRDLLYIYNTFIGDLPHDVSQFKSEINRLFPTIYDTRHLLNTKSIVRKEIEVNQSLHSIFTQIMQPQFGFNQQVRLHSHFADYKLPGQNAQDFDLSHEAGYDAMMTGVLWFKLQSILHHPIKREFPGVEQINGNHLSSVLDKNQIPL